MFVQQMILAERLVYDKQIMQLYTVRYFMYNQQYN